MVDGGLLHGLSSSTIGTLPPKTRSPARRLTAQWEGSSQGATFPGVSSLCAREIHV